MVTRETRYHVSIAELLKQNLMSHVPGLFRRPRTILKLLFFSGDKQFFKKLPAINVLYDLVLTLFIYWPGKHNLGPRRYFQQITNQGGHRGTWAGCLNDMLAGKYNLMNYSGFLSRTSKLEYNK